jgi:hydroxypyruvate isomerase
MSSAVTGPVANLTLLFTEVDFLDRPEAARAAGFDRVECWWPFGVSPRPTTGEVDAFTSAIERAGVELVHMNLFGGDMPAGERGVLSHPESVGDFADSLDPVLTVATRLGTRLFNVPYGHSRPELDPDKAFDVAAANLELATGRLRELGGTVLLEAVSGMPRYPIKTTADAVSLLDRLHERGITDLAYLLDQFHLVRNDEDVFTSVVDHADRIAHVQIADTPDRHEPGSGEFDFRRWLVQLGQAGYRGAIALEFNPAGSTEEALAALRETGLFA